MADQPITTEEPLPTEQPISSTEHSPEEQQSAEEHPITEEQPINVVNELCKKKKNDEFIPVAELAQFFTKYVAEETTKLNQMKSALVKRAQNPRILKKWIALVCEASKLLIRVDLNLRDMIKRHYVDQNQFYHRLLMHKAYTMTIEAALQKPELYEPITQRFKFSFPDRNGQIAGDDEYEEIEFLATIDEKDEDDMNLQTDTIDESAQNEKTGKDDKNDANDDNDTNANDGENDTTDANIENEKNNENDVS